MQADAACGPAGRSMSSAKTASKRPLLIRANVRIMAVLTVARDSLNFGIGITKSGVYEWVRSLSQFINE